MIIKPPFSYQPDPGTAGGFRVRDNYDNRVATCYDEDNAKLVTLALNANSGGLVEWSCGHVAGSMCATCWGHLAQRGHVFVEIIDSLLDLADRESPDVKSQVARLTSALHGPISSNDGTPTDKT